MAKLSNGILGPISGKVAGVVGGTWKGINYVRAHVIPANPNSAGQQTQRGIFTVIQQMASSMLASVIQPYWDPFAVKMSGFNKFMQTNLNLFVDATDFELAKVAQGSLESCSSMFTEYNPANGYFYMTWSPTVSGNGLGTDTAIALIYDSVNLVSYVFSDDTRSDAQYIDSIALGLTLADLKSYIFFSRGSGDSLIVSDSRYSAVFESE